MSGRTQHAAGLTNKEGVSDTERDVVEVHLRLQVRIVQINRISSLELLRARHEKRGVDSSE